MKSIIVAAGIGSRLGELTKHTPKSLIDINGQSILERQISIFKKLGISDITVIIGYDQEHFKYILGENDNIIKYLANLIDIVRFNCQNTIKTREIINTKNVISLSNPMKLSVMDFNKEDINEGFDIGIDFANTFYKSYIKDFNEDMINSKLNDKSYNPFEKYYS